MIESGFLLIDKPAGITSAQLVGKIKKSIGVKKIGHTGTLDKFAEGLMILPFGKYTVFSSNFLGLDKSYTCTVRFGISTDSGDPEGEIVEEWSNERVTHFFQDHKSLIEDEINRITATTEQIPPAISALKVGGKRQSDLFRQGISFVEKKRNVRIYNLEYDSLTETGFTFHVHVSSGTYIRKIVMDLSTKIGMPMHVKKLVRDSVGTIPLKDANTFKEVEENVYRVWQWNELLDFGVLQLDKAQSVKIYHGMILNIAGLQEMKGSFIMMDEKDKIIAFCEREPAGSEKLYRYLKVFHE